MRKLLTFIILFLVGYLSAQLVYFGAGYNVSNGAFDELNFVIDRYNETREDLNLDPEMDNIHLLHGMSFDFAFLTQYFVGGFGLQYCRAKTKAQLVDDYNVKQQRDLVLRTLSLPLELGVALGDEGFIAAPGIGVNFLFQRYFTRSGPANKIDDIDFYKSTTDIAMQGKFFIKFFLGGDGYDSGLRLMIEPFYNLSFLGIDLSEMNRRLNPNTWSNDPDTIDEGFSHYGVRVLLVIGGS